MGGGVGDWTRRGLALGNMVGEGGARAQLQSQPGCVDWCFVLVKQNFTTDFAMAFLLRGLAHLLSK